MPASQDDLVIDDSSSEQLLERAGRWLEHCHGKVTLQGVVTLRPHAHSIACEVIDPTPDAHRCEEELRVLIENAARALAGSRLASRLPARPLEWRVLDSD